MADALQRAGLASPPTFQTFVATGTYTPPLGVRAIIVEVWGAGGSGAGASASAAQIAVSAGGAAGGYSRKRILAAALGPTETVTVGAGGAAPTAGNNAGNAGGTTSFGAHCSATGGGAGNPGGSSATVSGVDGTAGGLGSSGDVNTRGAPSPSVLAIPTLTVAQGGQGGHSLGAGGRGAFTGTSAAGTGGNVPGGGGGGAGSYNGGGSAAGGGGGNGMVVVTEFY